MFLAFSFGTRVGVEIAFDVQIEIEDETDIDDDI